MSTSREATRDWPAAPPLADLLRRWVSVKTRASRCSVAIAAPKGNGRLARIAESGPPIGGGGRRAALRRAAFRTGRARRAATGSTQTSFLPVVADGELIAVLEVELPTAHELDGGSIELLTGLLALVLTAERRRAGADAALELGLALTAHEIRGPLAGIRAVVDLFLDGELGRPDLRRASGELGRVAAEVGHLLEHGVRGLSPTLQPVNLAGLTRDVHRSLDLVWSGRMTLRTDGPVTVSGDPIQLHSALSNVVRNGLEYSPTDAPVRISVGRTSTEGIVEVVDRGPGIAQPLLTKIFDPLVRGNGSASAAGGRGLGLFLTKRVIEGHGGSIDVSSRPGRTSFVLRLPLHQAGAT